MRSSIRPRSALWLVCAALVCAGCGDDSHPALPDAAPDGPPDGMHSGLLDPKPACEGPAPSYNAPGDTSYIVSQLAIGGPSDGFDFTGDGRPDNMLAAVGVLASSAIRDSFTKGQIILPVEFAPLGSLQSQACVKFAFYVGNFPADQDGDTLAPGRPGIDKGSPGGDCNDHDPAIKPGATEIAGNRVDDDCDGLADETPGTGGVDGGGDIPSTDTMDMDGDGYSLAQGDCDDRPGLGATVHPGAAEICGDGLDNDCNGVADDGCDPYDGSGNEVVSVQPTSLMPDGMTPLVIFDNGTLVGGVLDAGPSEWDLTVPIMSDLMVDFHITAAHVRGTITPDAMGRLTISDGVLGGVLDARTLGNIKGLDISQANIHPDQSLLDVVFAGALGDLLGLRTNAQNHKLPDVDVDGDGLETFWDSNPADVEPKIDTCQDGDGTIITNAMAGGPCWLVKDAHGNYRFQDGLSTAIKFSLVPVKLGPVQAH